MTLDRRGGERMAPKLYTKPLTATVKERLKAHRIAPPTALASIHRLRPAEATAPVAEPTDMAQKKKKRRRFEADYMAQIVARMLKAQASGEETVNDIAASEGISASLLYRWRDKAKAANGAKPGSAAPIKAGMGKDLKSLSRELSEAMDHVAALKKRLRKMLGDE